MSNDASVRSSASQAGPPSAPRTSTSLLAAVRPTWSSAAALRAVRAAVVIPGLFALATKVVGDPQMALFATFGGFAVLVFAPFGGGRRDKAAANLVLGVAGSVLLTIGTAVHATTALAAIVTVPVAFCVLFAGIAGPNAALGATAVLLSYVLPAASPGTISMVPSRLAGWWLAVAAGTLAMLALSPRAPADRLRLAAARSAAALSAQVDAALSGDDPQGTADAAARATSDLDAAFGAVPYRPTGLAGADQALANLVESLDWTNDLCADLSGEPRLPDTASAADRRLLELSARTLQETADLLGGSRRAPSVADLDATSDAAWSELSTGRPVDVERVVYAAFHSQMIASAVRSVARDAIGASRVETAGARGTGPLRRATSWFVRSVRAPVREGWRLLRGHASARSVWTRNSARGAVALAAAVAVADLTKVQNGFWVVLAALSVLRTSEGATQATAIRGVLGTAAGFFVGAGVVLAIGVGSAALWAAFPLAVLVAAYTPGTAPFAVGQAGFTVVLSVLYNILVPIGWKVGVVRLEDVAIGAGVSIAAGLLFWPRGAVTVVADDLADAYHTGGVLLTQSTSWALGARATPPELTSVTRAGERLTDAMRAMLSEQSTKKVPKEQLWHLVSGTLRLRLSAQSLSRFAGPTRVRDATRLLLVQEAVELAGRCDDLASLLGRPYPSVAQELAAIPRGAPPPHATSPPIVVLVHHLLGHVRTGLATVMEPARVVGARRAGSWWR